MSRKMRRVNFSPEANDKSRIYYNKQDGGGGNKKMIIGIWSLKIPRSPEFSPVSILKCVGAQVASVFRPTSKRKRSSRRVSSASLARSRSYAETLDSQRIEAIEDCIEFLNSSSSLQRSNSVSSSC